MLSVEVDLGNEAFFDDASNVSRTLEMIPSAKERKLLAHFFETQLFSQFSSTLVASIYSERVKSRNLISTLEELIRKEELSLKVSDSYRKQPQELDRARKSLEQYRSDLETVKKSLEAKFVPRSFAGMFTDEYLTPLQFKVMDSRISNDSRISHRALRDSAEKNVQAEGKALGEQDGLSLRPAAQRALPKSN